MNAKHPPPLAPAPGITLTDIYYIIFRHKWLILVFLLLAVLATIGASFFIHPPYQSEAKLLIKYVTEIKPPDPTPGMDTSVTAPDPRGENIINTEIEILTSQDLINNVVDTLTPGRILAKAGGGTNRASAAYLIRKGLGAAVTNRSDVIELGLSFPDPEMVQPILAQIIDSYLKMHNAIHSANYNEELARRTDEIKHKLDETESQLREAEDKAGIINIDDSKKTIGELSSKTEEQLYQVEADLAAYQQRIDVEQNMLGKPSVAAATTNAAATQAAPAPVPPDKVAEYQQLRAELQAQQTKEQDQLSIYTTNNPIVKTTHALMLQTQARKQDLETKYPGLLAVQPVESKNGAVVSTGPDPMIGLNEDIIKAKELEAKIKELTNQITEIRGKASAVAAAEGTILQLQLDRNIEATNFTYYSKRLEEAQADAAVQENSNISIVENPTPPSRNVMKMVKTLAGIFAAGIAFAFGLPFLIELVLDRSLKHPTQVQSTLGLPFFISIPAVNGNGKTAALKGISIKKLLPGKTGGDPAPQAVVTDEANGVMKVETANGLPGLADGSLGLGTYYETLRDRLMTYFEMINLTHKPKLVAVTSCAAGAGVTSTAAGLASSLSETGDGNVLLVNMNVRDGEAHHFYKGKLACGLDQVLEKGTRETAQVGSNLYVAREVENDDKLPRILPKRFNHLLPKMKASDFDYIIFDMPPVSQISITPRLARFMDMVLLVVESEKTDRDVAKRVATMLSESKTNVGVVLNKNRSYLPRRLHQDV